MIVLLALVVLAAACQKETLPYKFVSDTKPAGIASVSKQTVAVQTAQTQASSNPAPAITWDCKDTDYGDNIEAKGIVTGKNPDGTTFSFEDECFGGILLENNCVDDKPESRKERCERGCQNGFCI